jgi:DNA-binding NtrC family response regulator
MRTTIKWEFLYNDIAFGDINIFFNDMIKRKILIVDDEPDYSLLLKGLLQQEGYQDIDTETNPLHVESILKKKDYDLIILDVYMPQMNGLELLEIICQDHPSIPVIMVTAVDNVEIALKAIKIGAYEYITKPPDTDRLFLTIKRALEQKLLEKERDSLRTLHFETNIKKKDYSDIITNSPLMFKVFELIEIFAPTNETVLIVGETGTGKDLIARKIHERSAKCNQPFVTVNLASISPSLFESELFGHEKGAFTGAAGEKKGYFEIAHGGTIFLDEIGELPKELQGKLLRTIQYSEIYRIGSPKPRNLDIRIIAATNKDLLAEVNNKEFRADLYYRLNRGFITLPPLRFRGDDALLLAEYFRKSGNKIYNKTVTGFTDSVLETLKNYPFPGNIRELENIILNAVAKTQNDHHIGKLDIPENTKATRIETPTSSELKPLEEVVNNYMEYVFKQTGGSLKKTSLILGVSERTLQRRFKRKKDDLS